MRAGLTVLAPVKPSIMTDFFASRAANQTMRCDDFLLTAVPKVRAAHQSTLCNAYVCCVPLTPSSWQVEILFAHLQIALDSPICAMVG